ncbi:hypothetical protein BJ165DRAFT_1472158 [Panaeolus papilionaceus]|nr:hypothetical protein BJ165DRAFT_1472158 [Panaeolus papilionaceus]
MPTLSFKTKLRANSESASLSLNVRHNIIAGQPSDRVHNIKPSLLAGLDILLPSNLLITISGRFNRSYIPPAVLEKSQIASHLVQYFNTNAENLCINAVSPACMVDSIGFTTITLSCSRPLSEPRLPISIALDRIHLFYDWQTNSASTIDDCLNPFSCSLPLPYLTLVEDVAQRFTTSQLVRRYPIIFGNWSKQLHLEKKFAPLLWSSIHNIIENSPNEDFKESSRRTIAVRFDSFMIYPLKWFQRMRGRMMAAMTESVSRLSEHVEKAGEDATWTDIPMGDDKDTFGYCMHYLYCRNMRRPMFKSHTSGGQWSTTIQQTDLDLEFGLAPPHSPEENVDQSCDEIDLFDDDEVLQDSGDMSLSMNNSGALNTGSIESSQATFYDLECGSEGVGYEVVLAALHASWSQDGRPSQKHLTHPIMGMDLDPTKVRTSGTPQTLSAFLRKSIFPSKTTRVLSLIPCMMKARKNVILGHLETDSLATHTMQGTSTCLT